MRKFSGLISLLLAVAFVLAAPPLRAEKNSGGGGIPPPPMEVAIKVKREVRTEIPLQIYGRRNELLKFLIRTPPEHGQITEPQQSGKEAATVIYEPPTDLSVTRDRFFFSVQSSEGVSSPVEVSITITDSLPILAIPGPVTFPKILAGTISTKIIELSNRGGGLAVGEMIVDPPWRIAGSSSYRIGAGEVAAFKLIFASKEGGVFDGSISFSSNRERSTALHGEVFAPLSVSSAKVVMENDAGDPVRTGSFEIFNQTDEGRTLLIHGGPRLLLPEKVNVSAHGKVTIPIQTPVSDVAPIDAEIRVESGGFSLGVPVKSAALGPILKLSANSISLGKQLATKPGARSLEIENIGGLPGTVNLSVAAPFIADPSKAVINAGEKKSILITLAPSASGKYRSWLEVKAGRQEFEVGLEAELYGGSPQTRAVAGGGAITSTAVEGEPSNAGPALPEGGDAKTVTPTIPAAWGIIAAQVPGVTLIQTAPDSVTFEWPDNLSSATRFRFEVRRLSLNASHELTVSWIEHRQVTVEHKNGLYVARLGDLRSNENSAVEVLPLNEAGEPGPRLFALNFTIPPAAPSAPQVSALQWLLLVLVAFVGIGVWRAVRQPPTNYL